MSSKRIKRGEEALYIDKLFEMRFANGVLYNAFEDYVFKFDLDDVGCDVPGGGETVFEVYKIDWIGAFGTTRNASLSYYSRAFTFTGLTEGEVVNRLLRDPARLAYKFSSTQGEPAANPPGYAEPGDYLFRITQPHIYGHLIFNSPVTPSTPMLFYAIVHGKMVGVDDKWYLKERIENRNWSAGVGVGGAQDLDL